MLVNTRTRPLSGQALSKIIQVVAVALFLTTMQSCCAFEKGAWRPLPRCREDRSSSELPVPEQAKAGDALKASGAGHK